MRNSNASKVIRSSAMLVSSQMGTLIFSIFYFALIANTFSKMEMAIFAAFTVITSLSQYITDLGLGNTCVKKLPELLALGKQEEANFLARISVSLPILAALLLTLLVFRFSHKVSLIFLKSSDYYSIIRIIAFGIVTVNLFRVFSYVITAIQKFKLLSGIRITKGIFINILAYLVYLRYSISGYLMVLVCGNIVFSIIMMYSAKGLLSRSTSRGSIKRILIYSLPFYADGGVRYLTMHVDTLLVSLLLSPSLLAGYYVVKKFFNILFNYINALLAPIPPKLAEIKVKGVAAITNAFTLSSRYLIFAIIPIGFLLAALSYPILKIYGGERYLSLYPVLSILSIAGVLLGFFELYGGTLYILGKPRAQFYRNAFAGVTSLLLCLAFIVPFGVLGIAVSKCISLLGGSLFCVWFLKKIIILKTDTEALRKTLINSGIMVGIIVIGQLSYFKFFAIPLYVIFPFFSASNGSNLFSARFFTVSKSVEISSVGFSFLPSPMLFKEPSLSSIL